MDHDLQSEWEIFSFYDRSNGLNFTQYNGFMHSILETAIEWKNDQDRPLQTEQDYKALAATESRLYGLVEELIKYKNEVVENGIIY